jgi:hypothetical protein
LFVGGFTVTSNMQEATWPQASVTLQLTVVVPIEKVLPLAGVQVTRGDVGEQLSVAVGAV